MRTVQVTLDEDREVPIEPVTSTIREIPSEVELISRDGLPRDCAVNLAHLQTVAKSRIGAVITTLDAERMRRIRAALLVALGF
jgi:mRNA interferase MazF